MKAVEMDGIYPGLSPEERDDLENLIRDSVSESEGPGSSGGSAFTVEELNDKLMLYARIILELDERINAIYEVTRLAQLKSDLISSRIDSLASGQAGGRRGG